MKQRKIRPMHKLGQLFLRTPGHSLTPEEIYNVLKHDQQCVENCARTMNDPSIPDGPAKMCRMGIWITCLSSTESWNKHGGAEIITEKKGSKVIRWTLTTPERLNIFGQVMRNDAERADNEVLKARLVTDAGPVFPGMYNTITDSEGRVVPNDPMTGVPLLTFWSDQNIKLVLDVPKEEVPVIAPVSAPESFDVAQENVLSLSDITSIVVEEVIPEEAVQSVTEEIIISDPVTEAFDDVLDLNSDAPSEQAEAADEPDALVLSEEAILLRNKNRRTAAA